MGPIVSQIRHLSTTNCVSDSISRGDEPGSVAGGTGRATLRRPRLTQGLRRKGRLGERGCRSRARARCHGVEGQEVLRRRPSDGWVMMSTLAAEWMAMSEGRRRELDERALAEIEWQEMGLGRPLGSGLVEYDKDDGRYGDRTLHYFAYSYARAFEALWDAVLAGRHVLEYPMLFTWRHSMELWLKAALEAATAGAKPPPEHELQRLWEHLMEALHEVTPGPVEDVFARAVWPVVEMIDAHDVRGDRFRYPSDRRGRAYRSTGGNWEEVYLAHRLVVWYCDAVVTETDQRGNAS